MPNIGRVISSHNKGLKQPPSQVPPCNCTQEECPVEGQCQRENIIYQCTVTEEVSNESENYKGLTSKTFKDRYYKHKKSFRDRHYHKNSLSKHIWNLKDQNKEFKIAWKIIDKATPYSPATKICNLCVRECFLSCTIEISQVSTKEMNSLGFAYIKVNFSLKTNKVVFA